MKKIKITKILIAAVSISLLFGSYFFGQESQTSDDYETDTENKADNYEIKKTKKKEKNEFNPFEGFTKTKQNSYIFYDDIPHSTGTIGYKIKHRIGTAILNPKKKTSGIQTFYQSVFFNFLFDENNISLINEAYENYLKDFEEKKLIRDKNSKTRKIYCKNGKCRTEWGSLKSMMNYFGDSQFQLGYEFKDKKPYFCIIIKDCKNLATDLGSFIPEKSVEVQLYFTKAEARQFLDLIGREQVKKLLEEQYVDEDVYTPDEF